MQSTDQPANTSLQWPSLIQLILSLLAAIILIGSAAVIIISTLLQNYPSGFTLVSSTESLMIAASLAFAGLLLLPSAWYAGRQIISPEKEPQYYSHRRDFSWLLTILVVVVVAGALFLGNWSSLNNRLTWLLLPLLNIIATGLPALWLVYIGTRGLIPGSPRRLWGVFAAGLVLGPVVILVLELILLVFMGILALVWVMLNPSLADQLNGLVLRLQAAGPNMEALLKILTPFLLNPGLLFLIFSFIAVLVPILEEAIKPIGVWFLAGQKISPAQGFAYGVLSGAGYGLFENLGNTSGAVSGWALLASMRISTLLLHCFTAGLVGWALVSAWTERRYIRLGVSYAFAVLVHGLWNGLALMSLLASLQGLTSLPLPGYIQYIGALSAFGIIALGILVFFLFIGANTIFRRYALAHMVLPQGVDQPADLTGTDRLTNGEHKLPQADPEGYIGQTKKLDSKSSNSETHDQNTIANENSSKSG